MSKSLGNTLTGKEFLKKYDGNVLRFLLLSSHYRAPLNLTDDVILNAKTNVEKITNAIRQLHVYLVLNGHDKFTKEPQIAGFIEKMCDDLNTANAISELFNTVKEINLALRSKEKDVDLLQQLMINALTMCEILGIRNNFPEITQNDIQLYKEYLTAKKERNFARSDELRLLLTKRNIL
jgi:cysteinyl-tRNA synthetase